MKYTIFCSGKDCENKTELEIEEGLEPHWLCPACDKRDADFNINMDDPTGEKQENFCN